MFNNISVVMQFRPSWDTKQVGDTEGDGTIASYTPTLASATHYYPFGAQALSFNSSDYRYGFNGMEKDDEILGEGNSLDFGARIYDPRISRWLSVDPLQKKYPDVSPYNFVLNNPNYFVDPDGLEPRWGQLASLFDIEVEILGAMQSFDGESIYRDLESRIRNPTIEFLQRKVAACAMGHLADHFKGNRQFSYVSELDQFKEISPIEANVDRYIYTTKQGWIDMHHFFYFASYTVNNPFFDESAMSYATESFQDHFKDNASGFSYEDLTANKMGAAFGRKYGNRIASGNISVFDAVTEFLGSLGAVDPEEAPNFDYIPYNPTNEDRVTKLDGNPLVGEELKNAARNAHKNGKGGLTMKEQRNKAHEKIDR